MFALLALFPLALLAVLALLSGLALVAALLPHAALGELVLQFPQAVTQAFLVLLQVAHLLVAALLLAAHAVAARILALLERLVAQLLLLADHVVQLVVHLVHVAVAGLRLRHLQIFKHLLELLEQGLCAFLVALARQPLHALDHVVEVLLAHDPRIGIERPVERLRSRRATAPRPLEPCHRLRDGARQALGPLDLPGFVRD